MSNKFNTRKTLLCRLADQHDEESWEEFVQYYRRYIYLVIIGMNMNHHDADELTQQVLVKLWKKIPEFSYKPEKGKFRGWLCLITGNLVKDFIRKRKCYAEKLDTVGRENEVNYLSNIALPEIEILAKEEWEKYIAVMAWENVREHFSEKVCQVFLMLRTGKSQKEVARELNMPESTVSTYKKRITNSLYDEVCRLDDELSGM